MHIFEQFLCTLTCWITAERASGSLAAFLPAWAVCVPLTILRSGIQSICSWTWSWFGSELPTPVYSFIQRKNKHIIATYDSNKILLECFYLVSYTTAETVRSQFYSWLMMESFIICYWLIHVVLQTHTGRSNDQLEHSHHSSWSPDLSLSYTQSDGSSCIVWLYMSSTAASHHKALSPCRGPYELPGKSQSLSHYEHIDGSQMQKGYFLEKKCF